MTESTMKHVRRSPLLLAALLAFIPVRAADLELSLSLGSGFPVKPNLYLDDAGASGTSTFVQTRFSGPWLLGGLHATYEVYKHEAWKGWVGAAYVSGLGAPGYYKLGQATTQASAVSTEILDGTAKYRRFQFGGGATLTTGTLGEYGVFLWRRVNRIGLDGNLSTFQVTGTALTAQATGLHTSSSRDDFMLEFTMGFTQAHPTFKTLERIGLGTAFGPGFGDVGAGRWQLDDAYNDRLRPTVELTFSFGIRL